jgi:hypothetical protein
VMTITGKPVALGNGPVATGKGAQMAMAMAGAWAAVSPRAHGRPFSRPLLESALPWADYFYSGGYWYRPHGGSYIVVRPPYGVRVNYLPPYAREVWLGGALFFLVADTYYQYLADSQEYVVVNPPVGVPRPCRWHRQTVGMTWWPTRCMARAGTAGAGPLPVPSLGGEPVGFDPATATYAPPPMCSATTGGRWGPASVAGATASTEAAGVGLISHTGSACTITSACG